MNIFLFPTNIQLIKINGGIAELRLKTLQWRHNERLKSPASRLFAQLFV